MEIYNILKLINKHDGKSIFFFKSFLDEVSE